jgi:hypothetical protein
MKKCFILVAASFVLIFALSAFALPNPTITSQGQVVYVGATWQDISSTGQISTSRLVIRNIDQNNSIIVNSVVFLDPDGDVVKNLLDGFDCNGNPTGGPTSVTLNPLQTTSFVTRDTTVCVSRYPQDGGRPAWLVEWNSINKKEVVAPTIGTSLDILTPTSIYGHSGFPTFIIDAETRAGGIVLIEK